MKIALAQIEIVPGRPDLNFIKIKDYVEKAKAEQAELVIFPELSIPGYLIGDMWEENAFLKDCMGYNEDVVKLADGIDIIFGTITADFEATYTDGRPLIHNVAYYASNKTTTRQPYIKCLLPNYREFEEPRHFQSAIQAFDLTSSDEQSSIYFGYRARVIGKDCVKVGITICEDGWDKDYNFSPINEYCLNKVDMIINISCSPYTLGKNRSRNRVFGKGHAGKQGLPLIYVNAVGIQNNGKTVYTFDGSSVVYDKNGDIIAQAPMFQEHLMFVNYVDGKMINTLSEDFWFAKAQPESDIAEIAEALKYGIQKFLNQCGTKRVVIGISGGIDSAVAASLYAQVIGPENLLLVNMPSRYNSDKTKNIAKEIAKRIGCYYTEIPIGDSISLTDRQINNLIVESRYPNTDKVLKLTPFHFENVQARDRSSRILSALSCAWGGVFTNNGNKAETTVGYATLYGDVAGYLAALGDLWKHQVYELGRYLNKTYPVLPEEVFNVVPSAELSNEQDVTKGKGDPLIYWYHDKLFASWVEDWNRKTPEDNLRSYMNGTINLDLKLNPNEDVYIIFPKGKDFVEDLEKWYKLFKGMGVYKRVQAPPILAVSRRAFGFDYRESVGCHYLTRGYYKLKEELMKGQVNESATV